MSQHFFQSFFGPQTGQIQQQIPGYIIYNEAILEIINNWEFALELMKKYKEQELVITDVLDQDLINFLIQNKIDITKYKNEQEFLDIYWRNPEK